MSNIPTPHINAKKDGFAKTVIMAGDPLRVKYIAENFLTDAKLVSTTRNMLGYTGKYKNKKISVMGHGMGMPSMMIYGYELYNFYNVENIIRVGTSGGLTADAEVKNIYFADWAYTTSNINKNFKVKDKKISATKKLIDIANGIIAKQNLNILGIGVATLDVFDVYCNINKKALIKKGCKIAEMETYMLYLLAKKYNKNALSFLTVSDNELYKGKDLTAEERQSSLDTMIKTALEVAVKI